MRYQLDTYPLIKRNPIFLRLYHCMPRGKLSVFLSEMEFPASHPALRRLMTIEANIVTEARLEHLTNAG